MKCILKLFLLFLLLAITISIFSESLWIPDFNGYLSSGKALKPGDIILVSINSKTALSFISASNDDKNLTFEFSGGDYGNLLSFLPTIRTSGSNKLKGEETIKLESEIVTIVKTLDENGNALLEGSRNIEIDGKGESLLLTGTIAGNRIDSSRKVPFSQLVNSRLVYNTFITPIGKTLTEEDIIEALSGLTPATTPVPETAEGSAPSPAPDTGLIASPLPGSNINSTTYSISAAKKKELLLQYINKLINIIFN